MIVGFLGHNPKTHFKCGHEKTPENIRVRVVTRENGYRQTKWVCRECNDRKRYVKRAS